MKIRGILVGFAFLVILLSGCTKEIGAGSQPVQQVTMQIGTKAFQGGIIEGVKVDKIRLMLFDKNDKLVLNSSTSSGSLVETPDGKFTVSVETGEYQYVVIINESSEMTPKLNAAKSYAETLLIKSAWLGGSFTNENIPLVNYGALEVFAGATPGQGVGRATEFDASAPNTAPPTNPVMITMPRALSRISVFMRKGTDAGTKEIIISRVDIVNIPHAWSVAQQEIKETGNACVFTGSTAITNDAGTVDYDSKKFHDFAPSGYIVPEKYFTDLTSSGGGNPATEEVNGAYLFITATFDGIPTIYKVMLRENDVDFSLLRNTNYNVYITISGIGSIGIYAIIEPTKMYNISVNWKPIEGLVVVSDREADFGKNINIWSDYTAYSGVLKVYQGGKFNDVLFKYGSLLAINNDTAATSEIGFTPPVSTAVTNDVIWFPGEGYPVTDITNWTSIPYISDGSSFATENTKDLAAQGKGDPCRLAALTPTQIGVEKIVDNLQWRMVTPAEYALLMKAGNGVGSENNNGYRSFHELLIPNVKYRKADGTLTAGHNNEGRYWSPSENKAFSFSSTNLAAATVAAATPEEAYTVRCIRVRIPAADIIIDTPPWFHYSGDEVKGAAFNISSNVPYWKIELIKSGDGKGSSDDFDDFSFAPFSPGTPVTHTVESGYTSSPRIYVKRRESRTENRTFGIRFTSIHFTGEESDHKFMIQQSRYSIIGVLEIDVLDENKRLPAGANTYTFKVNLYPGDVKMPVGAKIKVEYYYHDELRGTSNTITTTADDKYQYEVQMPMKANGTPDVIGLVFKIYMDEDGRGFSSIGSENYYQNK